MQKHQPIIMTVQISKSPSFLSGVLSTIKRSIRGEDIDLTTGSLRTAVVLLSIPMMLEMAMESVFALVDLYFVGHLEHSSFAIQTVGLTESVLAVIYSLAIGLSMATTAVVARRIGEKKPTEASRAGGQAIFIALILNTTVSILGVLYAKDILVLMGASQESAEHGKHFTQIMMGSSNFIMLLFLINGIFRGAGNAAIAMKSLCVANVINIILCPLLINGVGSFEGYGLTGAAIATSIGRGSGVIYQVYHLTSGKHIIRIYLKYLKPKWAEVISLCKIAGPAVMQFVIASCSWIFLAQLVAVTGADEGSAGYQTALRLMMFFMLPAWGLSNAAATLVGQNLGAGLVDRAEKAVFKTAKYNAIYMLTVTAISFAFADILVSFFSNDLQVRMVAKQAIYIMSSGYVLYGIGMVLINAFNGAGDTQTPTWINLVGFWLFQIPLAHLLAKYFDLGPTGVFMAIPIAEGCITIAGIILFRKGKWKSVKV